MAIDTETKRKSILGFGSGDLLPKQDGTIDAGDRLTLLWLYSGIAAAAAATIAEGIQFSLPSNNPEFSLPTLPQFSEGTM